MSRPAHPQPPLVPFPTPPSSRHRSKVERPEFFASSTEDTTPPSTPSSNATPLPPHLQTLLTLHHAFNLALSLHIATHPPILPPHPPTATKVQLPNLTNFLALRETVERTSGRRFGLPELGRLAWIWRWDGESLPSERTVSTRQKEEKANPFLVSSDEPSCDTLALAGLTYLITPTRTMEPHTGRRVYTHGLGIELELRPGETRQMLHNGAEGGIGNKGQGGGMGAVGRWNVGGEAREDVVRQRLEKWIELNGGWEPPAKTDLPTPTSTNSERCSIPPIPLLPLPPLPSSTLLPAANLFASATQSSPGLASLPKENSSTKGAAPAGLADPFVLEDKRDAKGKVVRPGSVEERRQAMMDRLRPSDQSKVELVQAGAAHARLGDQTRNETAHVDRRATGSSQATQHPESTGKRRRGRMDDVLRPSPGPSTLPTPPRGRRKAIPLSEAAEVIVKSSKTPISTAEAQTSLQMLTKLCPFFLTLKTVARQEWIEMPLAVAACPPSPGRTLRLRCRRLVLRQDRRPEVPGEHWADRRVRGG
ncbi:hypothetical protein EHS25_007875 [Saitozyma podzolica]|uniref:DNA replication factor Cdt1 C-terminal domain-containing protein n=1 Tax=Saitozyma podzolica TaxID=1890683 RepID=A0A427YR19_9TREE|nr:hypothetical protein EHS25_007875 [Saitozyma podzolica]